MSDPAKIAQLGDVQLRLVKFTEHLLRAMTTGPSDQALAVSAALRRVSGAVNLIKQAQIFMSEGVPPTAPLREVVDSLQTSLTMLETAGRTDIPLGELRSVTDEIKSLAA